MTLADARKGAAVSICSLAMLIGTLTSGTASAAASTEGTNVSTVPVEVGTYNIRAGVSTEDFTQAVSALLPHVDVVGLQEVNNKDKAAVLAAASGWDYFRPPRFYGEQKPIMWKESVFEKVSARWVRIGPEAHIGNEVPGKSGYIKPQYASVVRLLHRATGQRVSVVNLHLVPGAVKAGRKWPNRPLLFRYYVEELARAVELTRTEAAWGKVFVLGDYNAGWVADNRWRKRRLPFMRFRGMKMRSMWATERPVGLGTHRDALIDQVFTNGRASRARILVDVPFSDHLPAVATYDLTTAS